MLEPNIILKKNNDIKKITSFLKVLFFVIKKNKNIKIIKAL